MTFDLYTNSVMVKPGEIEVTIKPPAKRFILRKLSIAPTRFDTTGFWYNTLRYAARFKIPFARKKLNAMQMWREATALEKVAVTSIEVGFSDKGFELLAGGPYAASMFSPYAFALQFETVMAQDWIRFKFLPHDKYFTLVCITRVFPEEPDTVDEKTRRVKRPTSLG